MKILTEKQYQNELAMTRNEMEERYWRKQEQDRMQQQIWDLQRRCDFLESKLGYSQKIEDAVCVEKCNSAEVVR